jgi:hypothetical protein
MSIGGGGSQVPMASNRGQQQQVGGMQSQVYPEPDLGGMASYPKVMPQQGAMIGGGPFGGQANDQQNQMDFMSAQHQMMGSNPQMSGGSPQVASPFVSGLAALMGSGNAINQTNAPQGAPNMSQPTSIPAPAGAGMPPGYRPTSGPIDGRHLRDMMEINRRRPMGDMKGDGRQGNVPPVAIGNDLPTSLKRPTQGGYKNFK